ncbi:MAG: flagellar hook-basal body complex protein FliE [Holosporales bacterium]|jgi:flagellar hook-basal body complex protein FliE|nr:flagellar hook-basal body complex protein FliE [Holosporales bacterium]
MRIPPPSSHPKINPIPRTTEQGTEIHTFSEFLRNELWERPQAQLTQAENLVTQAAIDPGINKLQLVTALTEAEIELQKTATIFSKVQQAYEKILHMPL